MSYAIHPTSFRLKYSSKLWGYSAISAFDKYCYKTIKYQLVLNKFLPRLLFLFGLILIKFKIFFTENLNLYAVVFKLKSGGGTRVKKKLIKRVRGYKPFSYRWWDFFNNKQTNFFYNYDYNIEDDEFFFYNLEFSDSKSWYFWKLFKNLMFKKIKNKFFIFKNSLLKKKQKLSFFNSLKKKKFNFLLKERTNFFFTLGSGYDNISSKLLTNFKFFKDFFQNDSFSSTNFIFLKNNLNNSKISTNNASLETLKDFTKIFFLNNPKIVYFGYLFKIFNKIKKIFFLKNYFRFFWKISFLKFLKIKPFPVKKILGYRYAKKLTNFFLKNDIKKNLIKKNDVTAFFLLKKKKPIKKLKKKKNSNRKNKKILRMLLSSKKKKRGVKTIKLAKFFYKLSKKNRRLWLRKKRIHLFRLNKKLIKKKRRLKINRRTVKKKIIKSKKKALSLLLIKNFFYFNFLSTVLSNYSCKDIVFSLKKLNYFFKNFKKKYKLFFFSLLKNKFFGTKLQKKFIKILFRKKLRGKRAVKKVAAIKRTLPSVYTKNRLILRSLKKNRFKNQKIKLKIAFSFSKFKKFVLPGILSNKIFLRKNLVSSKKKTLAVLKRYLLTKKKLKKKSSIFNRPKLDVFTKKNFNYLKTTRGYLQYFYFYTSLFYYNNFSFNALNPVNSKIKFINNNSNSVTVLKHINDNLFNKKISISNNFALTHQINSTQNLVYLSFLRFYSGFLNSTQNLAFKKNVLNKFLINSFLKKKYTFILKKKYKTLKFLFFKKKYAKSFFFKNNFGLKKLKKKKFLNNKKLSLSLFGKKILKFFLYRGVNNYKLKRFRRRRYFKIKKFLSKYYNKKTAFWRRGTFLSRTLIRTLQLKKTSKQSARFRLRRKKLIISSKISNWYYHNLKLIFRAYKKFKSINFNKKKKLRILFKSTLLQTTKSKEKAITFQKIQMNELVALRRARKRAERYHKHRNRRNYYRRQLPNKIKKINAKSLLFLTNSLEKRHSFKKLKKLLRLQKLYIPVSRDRNWCWKKNTLKFLKRAKKIFLEKKNIFFSKKIRNRNFLIKKKKTNNRKFLIKKRQKFFYRKKKSARVSITKLKKKIFKLRKLISRFKLKLKRIRFRKRKSKQKIFFIVANKKNGKVRKKLKFFKKVYYCFNKKKIKKMSKLKKRTFVLLKKNKSVQKLSIGSFFFFKTFFNNLKTSKIFFLHNKKNLNSLVIDSAYTKKKFQIFKKLAYKANAAVYYQKKLKKKSAFLPVKSTIINTVFTKKKITSLQQFRITRQNFLNNFIKKLSSAQKNKKLATNNRLYLLKKPTSTGTYFTKWSKNKRKNRFFKYKKNFFFFKKNNWFNYKKIIRRKRGWRRANRKWVWFLRLKTPAAVWYKKKVKEKLVKYAFKKSLRGRRKLFLKNFKKKIKIKQNRVKTQVFSNNLNKKNNTKKKLKYLTRRLSYLNKKLRVSTKKNKLFFKPAMSILRRNKKLFLLYPKYIFFFKKKYLFFKKRESRLLKKKIIFLKRHIALKRKFSVLKKNYLFLAKKKSRRSSNYSYFIKIKKNKRSVTRRRLRIILKKILYRRLYRNKKLLQDRRVLASILRKRKKFKFSKKTLWLHKNFILNVPGSKSNPTKLSKIFIKKKNSLLFLKKLRKFFNKKSFSKNLGFLKIYNKRAKILKKKFFYKTKINRKFLASNKKNSLKYLKFVRYFLNKKFFYKSFFQKLFYKKIRKFAYKKFNLFYVKRKFLSSSADKILSQRILKLNSLKKRKKSLIFSYNNKLRTFRPSVKKFLHLYPQVFKLKKAQKLKKNKHFFARQRPYFLKLKRINNLFLNQLSFDKNGGLPKKLNKIFFYNLVKKDFFFANKKLKTSLTKNNNYLSRLNILAHSEKFFLTSKKKKKLKTFFSRNNLIQKTKFFNFQVPKNLVFSYRKNLSRNFVNSGSRRRVRSILREEFYHRWLFFKLTHKKFWFLNSNLGAFKVNPYERSLNKKGGFSPFYFFLKNKFSTKKKLASIFAPATTSYSLIKKNKNNFFFYFFSRKKLVLIFKLFLLLINSNKFLKNLIFLKNNLFNFFFKEKLIFYKNSQFYSIKSKNLKSQYTKYTLDTNFFIFNNIKKNKIFNSFFIKKLNSYLFVTRNVRALKKIGLQHIKKITLFNTLSIDRFYKIKFFNKKNKVKRRRKRTRNRFRKLNFLKFKKLNILFKPTVNLIKRFNNSTKTNQKYFLKNVLEKKKLFVMKLAYVRKKKIRRKRILKAYYIFKCFEFIFNSFLKKLFEIPIKVYLTNVLKILPSKTTISRIRMYQIFLLTMRFRRKNNKKLRVFYYNFFNLYFYSIYFKNLILFLNFINNHFKTIRDQRRMVGLIRNLLPRCKVTNLDKSIIGLKFLLTGKINKRPRSRTLVVLFHRISGTQSLDIKIYYAAKQLFNRFGAFGVKFWLYSF